MLHILHSTLWKFPNPVEEQSKKYETAHESGIHTAVILLPCLEVSMSPELETSLRFRDSLPLWSHTALSGWGQGSESHFKPLLALLEVDPWLLRPFLYLHLGMTTSFL